MIDAIQPQTEQAFRRGAATLTVARDEYRCLRFRQGGKYEDWYETTADALVRQMESKATELGAWEPELAAAK
jgi:hypothetical protein